MNSLMTPLMYDPAHHMPNGVMNQASLKGTKAMLLYEELARERMREAERVAREHRLVRLLSVARRWERVSKWAARRASRAVEQL